MTVEDGPMGSERREATCNHVACEGPPSHGVALLRSEAGGEGLRERLWDAFVEVEAGYVNRPDRTTRTYWNKIAVRLAGGSDDPA